MVAPAPAAWAASAASGSTMRPIAARCAFAPTSARSMPVVSELPPAPGLSCVSAITTGRVALRAIAIARRTPSSGV